MFTNKTRVKIEMQGYLNVLNRSLSVLLHGLAIIGINFSFMTHKLTNLIKMYYYRLLNKSVFPYVTDLNMAAWPYDQNVEDYGDLGVEKSIDKAKLSITKLMDLLDKNGIEYSIGVYPYPQSMFHDQINSRHVKIWEDMCENRCKYFFNNFTKFFEISKKIGPIETY